MSCQQFRLPSLLAIMLAGPVAIALTGDSGFAYPPATLQAKTPTAIADLLDGNYFYTGAVAPEPRATQSGKVEVVFRKTGKRIVGRAIAFADGNGCFRGELRQNTVYQVVLANEPENKGWRWQFSTGQASDLSHYQRQTAPLPEYGKAAIQQCIGVYRQET